MNGHANGRAAEPAAVVIFGVDEKGRPHASRFKATQAAAAYKAAAAMGMRVSDITEPEHRKLIAKLPVGRIFGSGKAFVPFVRAGLYESLAAALPGQLGHHPSAAHASSATSPASANDSGGEGAGANADANESTDHKGRVKVGALVLATTGPSEGWYEAHVIELKGDVLKLRWRDWPEDPVFERRLKQVAQLPASYAG